MISIYTIFDSMELTSIYLCVPDPDTFTVTTIYDVRVHDAEDPSIYERGVVDPIGSSDPQKVVDIYLTGERSSDYFVRENNEAEMLVTVWLGILERSTGRLNCANAGHEYPALRRAGGKLGAWAS